MELVVVQSNRYRRTELESRNEKKKKNNSSNTYVFIATT